MPTYTYRCTKCGEEYEAFQSMSDPPLKRCKKCRGALRRTFHPVGIVLKGSGFHKTDYRSKSYSRGESKNSSDTDSSSKDTSKDTSSKDTSSKDTAKKDSAKTESKSSGSDS
jgi:putative FmdB family regulatory protein